MSCNGTVLKTAANFGGNEAAILAGYNEFQSLIGHKDRLEEYQHEPFARDNKRLCVHAPGVAGEDESEESNHMHRKPPVAPAEHEKKYSLHLHSVERSEVLRLRSDHSTGGTILPPSSSPFFSAPNKPISLKSIPSLARLNTATRLT